MRLISRPAGALAISVLGLGSFVHCGSAAAFDFGVSGQVDRAATIATNGEDEDVGFVDNNGSNSRFRFTGEQAMDNGLKLGFVYEIAINVNSSSTFDINNGGGTEDNVLDNRLANGYIISRFGKLTFGKLDGPANGTSEVNYTGVTGLGGGVDLEDYAAGLTFLDDDGNAIVTNDGQTSRLGLAFNEMDGLSRQNGVRYDTPSFGGVVMSASLDNGHAYELASRYEVTAANGLKFGAAADFLDSESQGREVQPNGVVVAEGDRFQEYGGSASLLFPIGFVLSGSYKHRDYKGEDPIPDADNIYGSVGWVVGKHHVEFGYDQTNDKLSVGSRFRSYGLSYVYDWTESLELYSSYHHYTLSDAQQTEGRFAGQTVDAQSIDNIYLGFRLKFL